MRYPLWLFAFYSSYCGADKDRISKMLKEFDKFQKEYDVSISCGYEYVDDGSDITYHTLFKRADRKMYLDTYIKLCNDLNIDTLDPFEIIK